MKNLNYVVGKTMPSKLVENGLILSEMLLTDLKIIALKSPLRQMDVWKGSDHAVHVPQTSILRIVICEATKNIACMQQMFLMKKKFISYSWTSAKMFAHSLILCGSRRKGEAVHDPTNGCVCKSK